MKDYLLFVFFTLIFTLPAFGKLENTFAGRGAFLSFNEIEDGESHFQIIPAEAIEQELELSSFAQSRYCAVDLVESLLDKVLTKEGNLEVLEHNIIQWRHSGSIDDILFKLLRTGLKELRFRKLQMKDASGEKLISQKKLASYQKKYALEDIFSANDCAEDIVVKTIELTKNPWRRKSLARAVVKTFEHSTVQLKTILWSLKDRKTVSPLGLNEYWHKLGSVRRSLINERKLIEEKYRRTDVYGNPLVVERTLQGCRLVPIEQIVELKEVNAGEVDLKEKQKKDRSDIFFQRPYFKNFTLQERLYQKYSDVEIILMGKILLNTARRLEADCITLNIDFDLLSEGEIEYYVLSPMEQYRFSLKMLSLEYRKIEQLLKHKKTSYEEIVMAALETGVITEAELRSILEFEEFWNPKNPKWKKYVSFALTVGRTASLAIPFPFNFAAAGALTLIQSTFFNPRSSREENRDGLF